MVEVFAGTAREVRLEDVPESQRFVYLKDGVETSDPAEATERIPIVEVRMISIDERGHLVSKDDAAKLIIEERGPEGRPLRHTTMVRNKP